MVEIGEKYGKQNRNSRKNRLITYEGRTQTLGMRAAELGVERSTLGHRLRSGWSVERAFTKPVGAQGKENTR